MENSFYTEEELSSLGFAYCGKKVLISKKASFYGISNISIGDNSRIDDFCIISGNVKIGKNVHIAAYVGLFGGKEGIFFDDYSVAGSKTSIYAMTDDFSGYALNGPTFPDQYRRVYEAPVFLRKLSAIGAHCLLLPGAELAEGTVLGAMSYCSQKLKPWSIYLGNPCRKIRDRERQIEGVLEKYLNVNK